MVQHRPMTGLLHAQHYSGVTWGLMRPKSPTIRMFVQLFVQDATKSITKGLDYGRPLNSPMDDGFPSQRAIKVKSFPIHDTIIMGKTELANCSHSRPALEGQSMDKGSTIF